MQTWFWLEIIEIVADDKGFGHRANFLRVLVDPFEEWNFTDGILG